MRKIRKESCLCFIIIFLNENESYNTIFFDDDNDKKDNSKKKKK